MILDNEEVEARLSSPENLLNRLKSITKSHSVCIPEIVNNEGVPSVSDLVDNLENKITGGRAYTNALNVLSEATESLRGKIGEVKEVKTLSRIAADMSKIVGSFAEKDNKNRNNNTVIVYKPVVNNESHYETVYANE